MKNFKIQNFPPQRDPAIGGTNFKDVILNSFQDLREMLKQVQHDKTGQIVLILVLITVVGLTVGLSLVSRTITDVRISSQL